MENLLGLNMRINCFGDKVSSLHCKIVLLDEQQLVHEVLVSSTLLYFLFFSHILVFLLWSRYSSVFFLSLRDLLNIWKTPRVYFIWFYFILPLVPRYGIQNSFRSRPLLWHGHDRVDPGVSFLSVYCSPFSSVVVAVVVVGCQWRTGCWRSPPCVIGRNRSEQRHLRFENSERRRKSRLKRTKGHASGLSWRLDPYGTETCTTSRSI